MPHPLPPASPPPRPGILRDFGRLRHAVGAGVLAATLLLVGCPGEKPSAAPVAKPTDDIPVAAVERRDLEEAVEASGFVESVRAPFDVRPEISGRIANIHVDTGSPVKAGDRLLELDDTLPNAELEEATRNEQLARLDLDRAERDLRRQESLFSEGFSTEKARLDAKTEADFARIRFQVAGTRLNKARVNLAKTVIRAPFDGFVSDLSVSQGQIVGGSGTLLMRIYDFSKLRVVAKFNEFDAARLAVGRPATVTFDSLPGVRAPGIIGYVSPFAALDQSLRVFTAKVDFSPKDAPVRPGVSATVRIVTRSSKNALCAPLAAVFARGADRFVYVKNARGEFTRRAVTAGLNDSAFVEIREGVAEGETLALTRPPDAK